MIVQLANIDAIIFVLEVGVAPTVDCLSISDELSAVRLTQTQRPRVSDCVGLLNRMPNHFHRVQNGLNRETRQIAAVLLTQQGKREEDDLIYIHRWTLSLKVVISQPRWQSKNA